MSKTTAPERQWKTPAFVPRENIIERSQAVLAADSIAIGEREDIFRVSAVGLDWDMGLMAYTPAKTDDIARGADGKKIGIFMLHGGSGDYKSMEPFARLFAEKFGCKVVSMSFPGRHYLEDPARDWPGDTINPDGSVRTPIWQKGEAITRDQYDVVKDTSKQLRYATRTLARAKPGTTFWNRMAGWPAAFEEGMKDAMRRHFPQDDYSIYVTGHSTGGPITFMISQRVPNIAGVIAVEHSPFGFIHEQQQAWSGSLGKIGGFERVKTTPSGRDDPFNELYIRTWRDIARYRGPEALGQEGPNALMRLPSLMEEILTSWENARRRPQFKAEYIITHNIGASLERAARATAERLQLDQTATDDLVRHYRGYAYPLTGPGAKPVPPVLYCIAKDSRDHSQEVYEQVVLPLFKTIEPVPRVELTRFGAGVHFYVKGEEDLPLGIAPVVAEHYVTAIQQGYFVD